MRTPGAALPALPPSTAVHAPLRWRCVDFISDLHLESAHAATFAAWERYMASTPADGIFILGDLFEVWVGDDVRTASGYADSFTARCERVLSAAARRLSVYFMPGNRDFLLGNAFIRSCSMSYLADPSTLEFDQQRYLLSHGDALCLDDTDYQNLRQQLRSAHWCADFLAKPLAQRQALARAMREQSEKHKASTTFQAELDPAAARSWLQAAQASTLIHGHTHRPGEHALNDPASASKPDQEANPALRRLVLSDWCAESDPPRLQVLRLQTGQPTRRIALTPS